MEIRNAHLPDLIVGDLDSIRDDVRAFYVDRGCACVDLSHDQDSTDLHKAIAAMTREDEAEDAAHVGDGGLGGGLGLDSVRVPRRRNRNRRIFAVGALGGRLDHELSHMSALREFDVGPSPDAGRAPGAQLHGDVDSRRRADGDSPVRRGRGARVRPRPDVRSRRRVHERAEVGHGRDDARVRAIHQHVERDGGGNRSRGWGGDRRDDDRAVGVDDGHHAVPAMTTTAPEVRVAATRNVISSVCPRDGSQRVNHTSQSYITARISSPRAGSSPV